MNARKIERFTKHNIIYGGKRKKKYEELCQYWGAQVVKEVEQGGQQMCPLPYTGFYHRSCSQHFDSSST